MTKQLSYHSISHAERKAIVAALLDAGEAYRRSLARGDRRETIAAKGRVERMERLLGAARTEGSREAPYAVHELLEMVARYGLLTPPA